MGGPEKISLSGEPWIQCHDRITTHHQDQVTPPPPSSRFAPKTPTLRGVAVALARSNQHGRGSAVPSSLRAAAARERLRTRGAPGARVPTGARAPRQDGRAGRGGRGLIFARGRRRPIYTRRGRAHLRRSPSVAAPARRCSSSPSALLCRTDGGGRSRTAGPGPSRPSRSIPASGLAGARPSPASAAPPTVSSGLLRFPRRPSASARIWLCFDVNSLL